MPANTKFLWLVVMGAPTEHWIHVGRRGFGGGRGARGGTATSANTNTISNDSRGGATNANTRPVVATSNANEQWPYRFKLTGTSPDDSIVH